MKIEINNFKKFNPRNDLKSMPWIRLENNFYDGEDFFDEDITTRYLFIFLLCQCAQKVSGTIEITEKYLLAKSKLKKHEFLGSLSKLQQKQIVTVHTNESDRICTDSCLTNGENGENEDDRTREKLKFDIEKIYAAYPRKQGKAKGIEKLRTMIKNDDEFNLILNASKNYSDFVKAEKTEQKYIKQFSTWVNQECWSDEYEIPKTQEQLEDEFNKKWLEKFGG